MITTPDPTPPAPAVTHPLIAMRGIDKSFFGVKVLSEVDFDCLAGEVHGVVGENGAGKSTLMKILAGAFQPDAGTIRLNGEGVRFSHPSEAQRRGVSIMYQEFTLLPERTVAQNIFLGREPVAGPVVDGRAMEAGARRLLAALDMAESISPGALVRDLSVSQQQMVEIAKALSFEARVLIMDEPTAALAPHEVGSLFARIRLLRQRGLGIIYISHRLAEVFDLADRITVLKDGRRAGTVGVRDITHAQLVRMMVGRELAHYFPPRARPEDRGEVRLRLRGGAGGILHGVDIEVRAGEIVGVAGLEGSGTTELARLLFGADPLRAGTLELDGKRVRILSPKQGIRSGMGFLSEDRKAEGLVLPLSIQDNTLLAMRSLGWRLRRLLGGNERRLTAQLAQKVDLRTTRLDREVRYLSGGNQQKVVLAKWLATQSRLLIFDEPTRGIDVGAKAGIHEVMRDLARHGTAIVMISSELPEVIGMSDRIVVMRNGTVAGELPPGSSEAEIMLLATGEAESRASP
jgi:ribose transport system ATP-binding protein